MCIRDRPETVLPLRRASGLRFRGRDQRLGRADIGLWRRSAPRRHRFRQRARQRRSVSRQPLREPGGPAVSPGAFQADRPCGRQLDRRRILCARRQASGGRRADVDKRQDQLKGIGCDTAKSVLELSVEDLAKRTDLEVETVQEVVNILKSEFE